MFNKELLVLIATAMLAAATVATAAPSPESTLPADDVGALVEVVVTARRTAENLENVPVSEKVISGDAIQKLSIFNPTELSKLAPGLNIFTTSPDNPTIVLRGVVWAPGSGTPATPIYFNEIPFDPQTTIQSIFDVGQVEVLRGPQGTLRGAPSISGAVTITTRRPNLEDFGGYVQGSYGSGQHEDLQGAVNLPIINDKLAVRLAGNYETSEANRVRSVHSPVKPLFLNATERLTALFMPIDTLSFQVMYQHRSQLTRIFDQVVGTGSPGLAAAGIPANFNGPPLTLSDRKSVEDQPGDQRNNTDFAILNATWDVAGQELSYNYGRAFARTPTIYQPQDIANFLPGYEYEFAFRNASLPEFFTQEVRLSSIRGPDRLVDYDVGFFQKHSDGTIIVNAQTFLSGAFGAPGAPPGAVTTPNSRYVLPSTTGISIGQVFDSVYGNLLFHLGDNTELSGGLRHIRDRVPVGLNIQTFPASTVAAPLASLGGLPCAGIPGVFVTGLVNSVYPGWCDANLPAGIGNQTQHNNDTYSKTIYDFSLSHKFLDNLLGYFTTGSSYRSGLPAINNPGLPAGDVTPAPETAKSYELGVKTTLGPRLRINADVFHIDYKGQLTAFQGIDYWNTVSSQQALTSIAFYRNVDSKLDGVELEIAAEPINRLSLGADFSYSRIESKGGNVPCNDPTRPVSAANPIDSCPSVKGQVLNQAAPIQATFNGSYEMPLGPLDGYLRYNLNFQGNNPNYGNFLVGNRFTSTPAYATFDLFAGLTGNKAGWDAGLYVKNVFDKDVELARSYLLTNIYPNYAAAPAGYDSVRTTAPREVGVTLRYAFGSR
jgi:iron complex outermembrane receptor protein